MRADDGCDWERCFVPIDSDCGRYMQMMAGTGSDVLFPLTLIVADACR